MNRYATAVALVLILSYLAVGVAARSIFPNDANDWSTNVRLPPVLILVPQEPTEAMLAAGWAAYDDILAETDKATFEAAMRKMWLLMLAAAPPAASGLNGRGS